MKCRLSTTVNAQTGPLIRFAHGLVVSHSRNWFTAILTEQVYPKSTISVQKLRCASP